MRVLLVDDHPVFRLGACALILARWPSAIVVEASSLYAALAALSTGSFDLIVLDLSLPDASGNEAPAKALAKDSQTPILVVSSSTEAAFASRLLRMGIRGFVTKDSAATSLVLAIERILGGTRYVTPELAEQLLDRLAGRPVAKAVHDSLTAQEYRVMLLIAAGKGQSEIATTMRLSVKTIGTYRARVMSKGSWTSTNELLKYCLQHGLTDPE